MQIIMMYILNIEDVTKRVVVKGLIEVMFQNYYKRIDFSKEDELWNMNNEIQLLKNYNHFHAILTLFAVLTNFPFTTSETMRNYYL